jgi:hypothetical protein
VKSDLDVIRQINTSALKVAIAAWHRQEFVRVEATHDESSFFREQFLDAFGHSDGVYLQLASAFDAFACAVAYRAGRANPHRADFGRDRADLARDAGGQLGDRILSTARDEGFNRLTAYRNVAAHRSVTTGRIVMGPNEEADRNEVRFTIGDPAPIGTPDPAHTRIRDILERDYEWARQALYDLYPVALEAWELTGHEGLRKDLGLRGEKTTTPSMSGREVHILVTEEELADGEEES